MISLEIEIWMAIAKAASTRRNDFSELRLTNILSREMYYARPRRSSSPFGLWLE